jgi:two-component system sensor histidine kinase HydH
MPLDLHIIRKGIIQPKYILAIAIVLIAVLVGMGFYELSASNRDLMTVLQEEATSIAEAINIMGDNSLLSFDEMMDLICNRALNNARLLEMIDYNGHLNDKILKEIIERNEIYQVFVVNGDGQVVFSMGDDKESNAINTAMSDNKFRSLLDGVEKEAVIDLYNDGSDSFLVSVYRRKGGAIAIITDANEIMEFKRSIGIGNLIQAVGENKGIEYIVLQDEKGIISASKNVSEMRRISGDSFLENALQNKLSDTRVYSYDGRDVFEVVNPFQIADNSYGLFRIGLSMKEANSVKVRSQQRLLIISLVALVAGVVILSFLLVNQNYSLLSTAYERIQTYTGTVLENIADGIIVADNKKTVSVLNKASERIIEQSADDLTGKSISNLNSEIEKIINDAYNAKWSEHTSEIKIRSADSGEKLLSINVSKITKTDDTSVIAVVRDVTESRAMAENIKRTEQLTAMGKLASGVAHEVRNPLNAISMTAQRLDREFSPKENEDKYRELTQIIKSESIRMNRIIEEFLKFAKPPKLNRQPTNIELLLDEVTLLIKSQAEYHNIKVDKQYSEIGIWNLDREQIKQVVLNLLLNGIEAMPDGGALSVKTWKEGDDLSIEVTDTGKGIPEDVLPRIFDLYWTTKDMGTGLGLSIVQRIIAEHEGLINVNSRLGIGTTFRIHLPNIN